MASRQASIVASRGEVMCGEQGVAMSSEQAGIDVWKAGKQHVSAAVQEREDAWWQRCGERCECQ